MARLKEIVVDSLYPASLARFWASALDGYSVREYDDLEIARLTTQGYSPETDPTVLVDGPGPTLCFQKSAESKNGRNRVHLDVIAISRVNEVARLTSLGGRVREEHDSFTVMLDPEGNEFCVVESNPANSQS